MRGMPIFSSLPARWFGHRRAWSTNVKRLTACTAMVPLLSGVNLVVAVIQVGVDNFLRLINVADAHVGKTRKANKRRTLHEV